MQFQREHLVPKYVLIQIEFTYTMSMNPPLFSYVISSQQASAQEGKEQRKYLCQKRLQTVESTATESE